MKDDKNAIYKEINDYLDEIQIISTHEHIEREEERNKKELNFFYLFPHYISSDLLKCGMPENVFLKLGEENVDFNQIWKYFIKYWQMVENTTYARVIKIILKDLFNITEVNKKNAETVTDMLNKTNKSGYYKKILKDKCNLKTSILDLLEVSSEDYRSFSLIDKSLFSPVMKFDDFININSAKILNKFEKEDNFSIHSFKDYEELFENRFKYFLNNGAIGIKIAISYFRTLNIEKFSRSDAEKSFNKLLNTRIDRIMIDHEHEAISATEIKPFQDYILYKLIDLAEEFKLPVQIHTGFLEGSGNYVNNSNPELLIPIFMEFEKVNFDIFHLSWPYTSNIISIVKMFRNVYIDFCWSHIVSERLARDALEVCIQAIPLTKIFAFGGDYLIVEGTYAHLRIAKENIANVLTDMISSKRIDLKLAYRITDMILNKNISNIFNIS